MTSSKEYDNIIKAFKIFKKYDHSSFVDSKHDEIHAGPEPEKVSPEDILELETLGWHDYGNNCFEYFT